MAPSIPLVAHSASRVHEHMRHQFEDEKEPKLKDTTIVYKGNMYGESCLRSEKKKPQCHNLAFQVRIMDRAEAVIVGDAIYRPLMSPSLSVEDVMKAEVELNETMEAKKTCLESLKEKLKNDEELEARMEDAFLIRFLRTRKFNVERAYSLVKNYYRFRAKHSFMFPKPSAFETVLRMNMFNYLTHRDSQGRAVLVMKIGLWYPDRCSFKEFIATGNMISELIIENEVTQINGFVGIWDFKDYGFQHFSNSCTPRLMWLLCNLMQDTFPGRFKVAYCVNCPPLADTVWKLFKPLIREKYRKRIMVFGNNWALLHQHIHPSILPREYGGELEESDCTEIVNKVLGREHMYEYNKKFGYPSARNDSTSCIRTNIESTEVCCA